MRTLIMMSVAAVSAAALAACADTRPVPYEKLAQENEVNGFRMAVVDVCLQSAISGTPVAAMSGEDGSIVPASATLIRDNNGKAGTLWSPRNSRTILIRADGQMCEVTTQGALTKASQASLEEALSDPHGFVVDKAEAAGKPTDKRFSKKLGTQTYRVTLAGAGMGGDAPSSKLTATVTSTPA
jgi:hypothetical protein